MSDDIQPNPGDGYNTDTVRLRVDKIEKKQAKQEAYQNVNHERLNKAEETGENIKIQLSEMVIAQAVRDERDETRHTATTKALGAQTLAIKDVAQTIAEEKTKSENDELDELILGAIIILAICTNLKDIFIFFANAFN